MSVFAGLQLLEPCLCKIREVNAVSAVDLAGNAADALCKGLVGRDQGLEAGFLACGVEHCVCQFKSTVAALCPVFGYCKTGMSVVAKTPDSSDLFLGVCHKGVQADHCRNSGLLDNFDVAQKVFATLLHKAHVLLRVVLGHGTAGNGRGGTTVALQGTDGGHNDHCVWSKAASATLDVPELLVADFRTEAGFRHVVVGELQGHLVGYD